MNRRASLVATLILALPGLAVAQEDAFSLDGLIVTAAPIPLGEEAVASHVTVITAAELEARGDRSLGEVLRDVSGLDVVRSGSFGAATSVFLRGGESDYALVLVDGVQVNQAGGGFDFASLTVDNVERIEIVRGPASALYGSDAVTGVIQVITRSGRGAPRVAARVRAGSYGRQDLSADVTAGTDRAAYALTLSRQAGDGILAFNNRHRASVLSGRARILPDERTAVDMTLRLTDAVYHFPTDGSGVPVDRNAFTFSDGAQLQASVRRALTGRLSVEARVGLNELDGGTDDAQDGPADTLGFYGYSSLDDFQRATAEVRAHVAVDRAVLTGGFEAERERQRSFDESASEFGPSSGRSESERSNRAAFVHASGSLGPVAIALGGRLEDNERFGRLATWQSGVSWLARGGTGTRLRLSVGTAIKEPTFYESFATGFAVGNPDLDPERARSWEVGAEQPLLEGRVDVRATWFDQRFEDLIQYTSAPPSPTDPNYFNVAAARARGVELDASARLGRVSLGLSRTWLDTEVTDAGFDSGPGATFVEGASLLRRPDGTWAARAAARLGAVSTVHARVAVVGARSDRDFATFPATPVVLSGYATLAAGAELALADVRSGLPDASITLLLENALDASYEEALGFRAPGRAAYVGVRVGVGSGR